MNASRLTAYYVNSHAELDLPETEAVEEMLVALRDRHREQTEALAARAPDEFPTATLIHLRASRLVEIRWIERVLEESGYGLGDAA